MNLLRSFGFLFGLSLLALIIAVPQPFNPLALVLGSMISAIVIFLGLQAAVHSGRRATLVELLGKRETVWSVHIKNLVRALLAGVLLGASLLLLLLFFSSIEPRLVARLAARADQPAWMPVALAIEASILEELVFRLFLMSGVIWLLTRFRRAEHVQPPAIVVWIALVISAFAFGLIHLPAWFAVVSPTPFLVTIVLVLNGLGGILLGWVYWQWGIESAILCHFAGDMMIQGLGPSLVGGG